MSAKYEIIAKELADRIRSGELPPGTRLPSTRDLRAIHVVSETVIRFVMVDLKARGLVRGEPGRAVFVADREDWLVRSRPTSGPHEDVINRDRS